MYENQGLLNLPEILMSFCASLNTTNEKVTTRSVSSMTFEILEQEIFISNLGCMLEDCKFMRC